MDQLLIMAALFGGLWFLLIRPQRAKAQRAQAMLREVEVGDEILTVGGVYGIVQEIERTRPAIANGMERPSA